MIQNTLLCCLYPSPASACASLHLLSSQEGVQGQLRRWYAHPGLQDTAFHTYRVAGATAQETGLPTLALSQAHLPCPGHVRLSKLQQRPGWLPITIATAAHELLGVRVLTRRRRATEGHLVTGSQHRSSSTCLTWVTASALGILSLKTSPRLPHCPSVSMLTPGLSRLACCDGGWEGGR